MWNDLSEQTQKDLFDWFNWTEVTDDEKDMLAELFESGQFKAWDCRKCGERVYAGDPDDWDNYQGVRQADFCSYPGDDTVYQPDYLAYLCDHCRCHAS